MEIAYCTFDWMLWQKELADFVPTKVFDAHCHLWRESDAGSNQDTASLLRINANGERMRRWSETIFPGRELNFYYLATPLKNINIPSHNEFMLQESQKNHMPAAALVTPDMPADQIAELFEQGFAGIKPYLIFSDNPAMCDIADYLPEAQMEVADQYHRKITLHLSKQDAILNPKNQKDIEYYSKKYPHAQWILAHCARAFNSFMLEEPIRWMAELGDNVWYDMSAVCDPYSHYLLMKHLDRSRLLFGTDNIGCGSVRGKYITWGHAWTFYKGQKCSHCDDSTTLVVYEQLRAMKQAADMAGLTRNEIKDIFWNNAIRLFG